MFIYRICRRIGPIRRRSVDDDDNVDPFLPLSRWWSRSAHRRRRRVCPRENQYQMTFRYRCTFCKYSEIAYDSKSDLPAPITLPWQNTPCYPYTRVPTGCRLRRVVFCVGARFPVSSHATVKTLRPRININQGDIKQNTFVTYKLWPSCSG